MRTTFHPLGKRLTVGLLALCAFMLAPCKVQAGNDYLQKFDNYSIMSMGNGVLRFTIPLWIYGEDDDNTYYLNPQTANNNNTNNSYVWFSEQPGQGRGSANVHRIASFGATRQANYNGRFSGGSGTAYLLVDTGTCVVTNTYNSVPMTLHAHDKSHWIIGDNDESSQANWIYVTRKNSSYGKHHVYIQFDWYIPVELQNKKFYVGLNVRDYYVKNNNLHNAYWWQWETYFDGGDIPQSPQLFDPFFYSMAGSDINTLGKAGVQYMTFQDPISYRTSLNPSKEVAQVERSEKILVDMQDSVQDHFYADFNVWINKDGGVKQRLKTNSVMIPAYHKIYDFEAEEVKDAQNSVTGDVQLNWHTLYPNDQDILEADMYEVQRATQEDFSDARSIGVVPYVTGENNYSFTDNAEDVLQLFRDDSLYTVSHNSKISVSQKEIEIENNNGFRARINATLHSDVNIPGAPLYYRVRRASAATWGWNESGYMAATSVVKSNYLSPLDTIQNAYTLDPDFENNRKVHFYLKIANPEIESVVPAIDEVTLSMDVDVSSVMGVPVPVIIHHTSSISGYSFEIKQEYNEIQTLITPQKSYNDLSFEALSGSTIWVKAIHESGQSTSFSFVVPATGINAYVQSLSVSWMPGVMRYEYKPTGNQYNLITEEELKTRVFSQVNESDIRARLYPSLQSKVQAMTSGERCVWDRNADLVLTRTVVENGLVQEFRVPKDSIIRQPDGTYLAHMTDVANMSCVHFLYDVRIDQSNSLLQVQKDAQLNPITLTGPDLYINSSAQIASFEATDGTDKRGVILTWQPTAGSVDHYILERRIQGSEAPFDTIAILETEGYFDEAKDAHAVVPGQSYEYRVSSSFSCNGTTTVHTASTEGRRSPYGLIAGRVQYEDGSGCYGTTVTLSRDGAEDIHVETDERGAFLFDSLLYGTSTTYSIVPTSQTAQFVFNNTSSPTATVTLSAENNVVENLNFDNISSVRFSGRVLYKLSSVPVRDANILLNGKMVKKSGDAVKTDMSGNFSISVPKGSAFTLQIVKNGHTFEGDGFVRIDGDSLLTLSKALDGVRIWDQTKVRLAGRVVGGIDQASLPLGQGLSRNNIGDNLQLVLELEGDNVAYIVRDPEDLTRDTLEYTIGATKIHYQHKRIVINPDPVTGEYEADLFPTKYKVVQATAQGYATLFAQGKTSETIDLSNTEPGIFSITYRTPIEVTYKQSLYGKEYDYYGLKSWTAEALNGEELKVDLVSQEADGSYSYLFGAPVFTAGQYQFRVSAHEDYYYNNDRTRVPDRVYLKGGNLKIYNGMRETTDIQSAPLDANGSALVNVIFDQVTYVQTGENALHSLDFSVESEGEYVTSNPLQAYVLGAVEKATDFMQRDTASTGITLLDILRDPPGSGSYAYLEKGTSYHVKYKEPSNFRVGLNLFVKWGNNSQYFVGTYAGSPAAGATAGVLSTVEKSTDWNFPLTVQWYGYNQADYEFKTTERIQTGTGPLQVGTRGDVYIGVTNGVMTSKADAFRVVDSISFEQIKAKIDNKSYRIVQQGVDANGKPWYLMRTEDVLIKKFIQSSFAYTHQYIVGTIIPDLLYHRNSLLLTGTREEAVTQAIAKDRPVYWSKVHPDSLGFGEEGNYEIITPDGQNWMIFDQVQLDNKAVDNWIGVLATNEAEKVLAMTKAPLATHSINGGLTQTYSESYSYVDTRSAYFAWPWNHQTGEGVTSQSNIFGNGFGPLAIARLKDLFTGSKGLQLLIKHLNAADKGASPSQYVRAEVGGVKFDLDCKPILETGFNLLPENGESVGSSKTTGYVLSLNPLEHLTFNVYKSLTDDFNEQSKETRYDAHDFNSDNKNKYLFGSLMYSTLGGATRCPWEAADSTYFYNPGTPLNAATQKIENPQMVINRHEISNVPHDQAAKFKLTMWNETDEVVGLASGPNVFMTLKLDDATNIKGAKISIDGVPLSDGREFRFQGNTPIIKTIEVRAGDDYDYEDICLILQSECTPTLTYQKVCFSVHYMPVSCDVMISSPSDKWIMNTLSPRDENGYYMPVSIDGFDVNYDGFDHIELQYKLTTQSNDAWVNLCSYYAEDSLYQQASGSKAMIEGGRIENFRFYGERDPMEQQYDLRAVSYCRHGSGYVTKSSPVLTGIKDTRPPRVFGEPEPANAILGVGDNLKLRFNEPIAGNYLDEDNNFQLAGYTNESGIAAGTSLHFGGSLDSYAESKVLRSFLDKSFTIDMMVRLNDPSQSAWLLELRSEKGSIHLVYGNNHLMLLINGLLATHSLPLPEPPTAFTRFVTEYDHTTRTVRFFVGTQDITNPNTPPLVDFVKISTINAPIVIGRNLNGNMMEVRLWSKALSADEVAETHMRRLTGYERELIAYYPMDEGTGDVLMDKATGATLYTHGTSWEHQTGISLRVPENERIPLDGNLMSRSDIQDETLTFWFKTTGTGTLFSAGRTDNKHGFELMVTSGGLTLYSDSTSWPMAGSYSDDAWHHIAMAVNRTYNNVAVYIDGILKQTFAARKLGPISGAMYFGGRNFAGNIDEFAIFEQALPKSLLESISMISPVGNEMGLMAYLPFNKMKENSNGIYEQIFSVNDQRVFKTTDGTIVDKQVPLVLNNTVSPIETYADKSTSAPVHNMGKLTKLNFDWAFNGDELMINLNMLDREINKRAIYVTVRNVEDLNGNPMVSPVTWTAYVDKNALKWEEKTIKMHAIYGEETDGVQYVTRVLNHSGKLHPYTIESLPDWLTVNAAYGSINPTEELYLTFTANTDMAPGIYEDIVYVTEENGLSEPLRVELTIEALPPYEAVDEHKYPLNMSVCAQVKLNDTEFDTDPNDIVYAFYQNECVGMDHVSFNENTHKSKVYLTVYGEDAMNRKPIQFRLWRASTGRVYDLGTNRNVIFAHGFVYNCGDSDPLILTTYGSEVQMIDLEAGWNWISTNMDLTSSGGYLANCLSANEPWKEGDIIKNPNTRKFSTYSETSAEFMGTLDKLHYSQIFMAYSQAGNKMRISGDSLPEDSMWVKVRGDGQWSMLPCLFTRTTPISEALASYFQKAQPGDLIKAHDRFAIFSEDLRWEGNLTALRPGEGYLFRRLGLGTVVIPFYHQTTDQAPKKMPKTEQKTTDHFHNPAAATNMTMIAKVEGVQVTGDRLRVFVNDELAAVTSPLDSLYFLTIQSDRVGELRFEMGDQTLVPVEISTSRHFEIANIPDSHHGSLKAPIILRPADGTGVYKIIENNHVVIIRNNEKYDVTGKKLK